MSTNNNLSIFAKALAENREFKNARMNALSLGTVANARSWSAMVKALRIPAYAIRVYNYKHMGDSEAVTPCDKTAFFAALKPIIDTIGEVNGAKLSASNLADEITANALRFRIIDITPEMAHAREEYRQARKAKEEDETEETLAHFEECKAEVERLEELPGNCKRIPEIQSESAFVKAVEILLGDAINKQTLKSAEQVAAEEEAKRQARRAATKAKRAAKKTAAKANA